MDRGYGEQLGEEAHGLKGASSTLGAGRLASVCAALERLRRAGDLKEARSLVSELDEAWAVTRSALEEQLSRSAAPGAGRLGG